MKIDELCTIEEGRINLRASYWDLFDLVSDGYSIDDRKTLYYLCWLKVVEV